MDHDATQQMREQKAKARASARRILAQQANQPAPAASSSDAATPAAAAAASVTSPRPNSTAAAAAAQLVIQQLIPLQASSPTQPHHTASAALQSNRLALMMLTSIAAHTQHAKVAAPIAASASSSSAAPTSIPRAAAVPPNLDSQWTHALLGRFHCLLSLVREAAPTPNTSWKYDKIKREYELQLAAHILASNAVPIGAARRPSALSSSSASFAGGSLSARKQQHHQAADTGLDRYAFRSEMLRAVDSILALFTEFHSKQFAELVAAPAVASGESLVHCAASLRRTLDALALLGRTLDSIYTGLYHRLWNDRGRDLLAHLFLHSEITMLGRSWTKAVEQLSEGYREAQDAVLAKLPEHAHGSLIAASPLASCEPSLSATSRALSSLAFNFLCAARNASKSWCDGLWPDLFGNNAQTGSTKGAENLLVRKHMPRPLPILPVYSTAAAAAGGGASSPRAAAGSTTMYASPSPSVSPSPPSASPSPSPKDLVADRPSPLLPLLEDYFLPLCTAGGEFCDLRSSGLVISAVLDSVLASFFAFLSTPRHRVRINAQGAARLNVELRWLWVWIHFGHIPPNDRTAAGSSGAAAPAVSPGVWPSAASPFLTSAGLSSSNSGSVGVSALSSSALGWWRTCCVAHLSGTWSRAAAIVQVLLQPRSYASNLPPKAKGKGGKPKAIGSAGSEEEQALPLWRWAVCGAGGCGGSNTAAVAAAEPQSSPSTSPGTAAAASSSPPPPPPPPPSGNRVAPLPPALAFIPSSSPSGSASGGSALSPSPSPSPLVEAGSNVLVDARGLALPDLGVWASLGLASQAHTKEFVAVGSAAVVDWPHRRD